MPLDHARALDRSIGCLVGLAVGDALGATLEFSARDSLPKVTEMVGGGPFNLPVGAWTDDTSMALCLADSLFMTGNADGHDLMQRFLRWYRKGENSSIGRCFDIGNTTRAALQRYEETGKVRTGWDVHPKKLEAGNGSLMRVAPVAIAAHLDSGKVKELAKTQSRLTHNSDEASDACAYLATRIAMLITGVPEETALRPQSWDGARAIDRVAKTDWTNVDRDAVSSSGYVVSTLGAALWCVAQSSSFETAVITAVNLGDDSDTVGAVTGQPAGAIYGYDAIPRRWTDKLMQLDRIKQVAMDLYQMA